MFERHELESLPERDVPAADKLCGVFRREHRRERGHPRAYPKYITAFGVLQAFLEARGIGIRLPELSSDRRENIEIIVRSFESLIPEIKRSESIRDARAIKSKFLDVFRIHDASPICYVIMPFGRDDSRYASDLRYKLLFRPAAQRAGYRCLRADRDAHTGGIPDRLIEKLVTSEAVIADLTGCNPNVLYELGLRHATSKKTIVVAPDGAELPFDLASIKHVPYRNEANMLNDAIREISEHLRADDSRLDMSPVRPFSPSWEDSYLQNQEQLLAEGRLSAFEAVLAANEPRTRMLRSGTERLTFLSAAHARLSGDAHAGTALRRLAAHAVDRDIKIKCALELTLLEIGRGHWIDAFAILVTLLDCRELEVQIAVRILAAACRVAERKPREAYALLQPLGSVHTLGGNLYAYVALTHAISLLALKETHAASQCFAFMRSWSQDHRPERQYPYLRNSLTSDRALLDLISDPYFDCTRVERLMGREIPGIPEGSAQVTARLASVLRRNGHALETMEKLADLESWNFNRMVTIGRLKWFERKVFQSG